MSNTEAYRGERRGHYSCHTAPDEGDSRGAEGSIRRVKRRGEPGKRDVPKTWAKAAAVRAALNAIEPSVQEGGQRANAATSTPLTSPKRSPDARENGRKRKTVEILEKGRTWSSRKETPPMALPPETPLYTQKLDATIPTWDGKSPYWEKGNAGRL